MAPELIGDIRDGGEGEEEGEETVVRHPYTPKSDMWALGVILYELCSLRKPFSAANAQALYKKVKEARPHTIPNISHQLMQVILRLLSKDPAKRPTARDLLDSDFLRSKALVLRIDLPRRQAKPSSSALTRF